MNSTKKLCPCSLLHTLHQYFVYLFIACAFVRRFQCSLNVKSLPIIGYSIFFYWFIDYYQNFDVQCIMDRGVVKKWEHFLFSPRELCQVLFIRTRGAPGVKRDDRVCRKKLSLFIIVPRAARKTKLPSAPSHTTQESYPIDDEEENCWECNNFKWPAAGGRWRL